MLGRRLVQLGADFRLDHRADHRLAHRRQVVFGLQRARAARLADLPLVVGYDQQQQDNTGNDQGCLERHAASAIEIAASISTATIRDTPCSCIVTPINWCAISIAILLWEMKTNWVLSDMRATILA